MAVAFTSHFLSFIVVEHIQFFHGALQLKSNIIIITKEYDYGGVMSRGLQGHLTNEIVRRESQRNK